MTDIIPPNKFIQSRNIKPLIQSLSQKLTDIIQSQNNKRPMKHYATKKKQINSKIKNNDKMILRDIKEYFEDPNIYLKENKRFIIAKYLENIKNNVDIDKEVEKEEKKEEQNNNSEQKDGNNPKQNINNINEEAKNKELNNNEVQNNNNENNNNSNEIQNRHNYSLETRAEEINKMNSFNNSHLQNSSLNNINANNSLEEQIKCIKEIIEEKDEEKVVKEPEKKKNYM